MAPSSLLRSTVFRRSLGVVVLLAAVAAGVIAFVGWRANDILTRATATTIEADVAELRAVLASRGLDGLAGAVAERSRDRGAALYRLELAGGRELAGNLAEMPDALGRGRRAGTFTYRPARAVPSSPRTAAGVLIDIDAQALLLVGRDVEEQRALLHSIYRTVGLGAGLLALIGLGGGLLLSRHILGRIDAMGAASAGIMAGNLAGRIPLNGSGDELDRLAQRLNEMLERIEQLMAGLREISDNIAHDLRTPLNRLRNRAEAALADQRGSPAWQEGLERVIEEADEIIKTFNALLLIARLEAGAATERFEPVDAADTLRELAELYEPVAEEAGFRLACSVEGSLPIRANRQLLGQAVTNLIDNALKYARKTAGGGNPPEIEVTARREADRAIIVVADRGPGIAAENRERALRRFVRLEQSRSEPGTGLGLSLVAAVARLHGGAVRLEDNRPGLRVVLSLPLATGAISVPLSAEQQRTRVETSGG